MLMQCLNQSRRGIPGVCGGPVRIRITKKPLEREVDGISLDRMLPGIAREVSPNMAAWLIAEGYAQPEMRRDPPDEAQEFSGLRIPRAMASDRRRRRSTDR